MSPGNGGRGGVSAGGRDSGAVGTSPGTAKVVAHWGQVTVWPSMLSGTRAF